MAGLRDTAEFLAGASVALLPFIMIFPLDAIGIEPPLGIAVAFVPSFTIVLLYGAGRWLRRWIRQ